MKRLLILCITALLILSITIGCQKQTTPASTPSPTASAPPQSAPASVPIPVTTSSSSSASTPTVKPAIASKTYSNSEHNFSVEYPADWDLKKTLTDFEKSTGVLAIIEGPKSVKYNHRTSIMIEADKCPSNFTAEEFAKAVEQQILTKNMKDFTNLKEQKSTVSGIPALVKTFAATVNNLPLKDIQAYLIKGNFAYTITYQVTTDLHDEYIGCFDLAIRTFKFN